MISRAIRDLVSRLHSDLEFYQSYLKAPESALGDQSLSDEERRAVLRLHARLATAGGSGERQELPPTRWP